MDPNGACYYVGSMTTPTGPRRRGGEIERLPSGSLRVRVYGGLDPASKRRRYLTETVPAGPASEAEAERVRVRLLDEAATHRLRAAEARRRESAAPQQTGEPVPPEVDVPAALVGQRRGKLTVAAIARLAGVSAPTVSKVLNGRAGVAAETRRRVERLLHEQGYRRPEKVARAASIEVVFYGMQGHLAVEVMRGVRRVAGERGLAVAFTDARQEESTGRNWAQELLARRPTGIIVAHMGFTAEQHGLLGAGGLPVVAVDPTFEPLHQVPSVAAANRRGGPGPGPGSGRSGHREPHRTGDLADGPLQHRAAEKHRALEELSTRNDPCTRRTFLRPRLRHRHAGPLHANSAAALRLTRTLRSTFAIRE